ncbi:hypothetical protein [Nonomuraea typhae]|uniref:hypothetical protein n=1 Tax=Nonomuraea typhae TaxID=2603600 RepID=UPI0012F78BF3|nr:hypothetical protein [Nonomuraea typhae]
MNPLTLNPAQWRVLTYLAAHGTSRAGIRADVLHDMCQAIPADLIVLADAGHIAGHMHGDNARPVPSVVITARNPRKLRIHLTRPGQRAATTLDACYRALRHLYAYGLAPDRALPLASLYGEAGTHPDTLTHLQRHGHLDITPGPYLAWNTGGYPHLYGPPRTAGRYGCDPCLSCGNPPPQGATIWVNSYGDLHCDPCARRNAGQAPTALAALTSLGYRYALPSHLQVQS